MTGAAKATGITEELAEAEIEAVGVLLVGADEAGTDVAVLEALFPEPQALRPNKANAIKRTTFFCLICFYLSCIFCTLFCFILW